MSGELKHKMYDYEVKPPKAVWDSIAGGLEEQEALKPLVKKMRAWEVTPPPAIWRNILAALKGETPVRRIGSRYIYRWSAAAAAVLVVAGAWYFNYSDTAGETETSTVMTSPDDIEPQSSGENVSSDKVFVSPVKLVSSPRRNRQAIYEDEVITVLPLSYVEDASPVNSEYISVTPRPILTASGELIEDMSVVNPHNDKYVTITAPNGQQTKVSSKLVDAIRYFNSIKPDPAAKDSTLQQRIHEWRNKILKSGFVPSSNNFMDILEMTDLVEEKEEKKQLQL